MYIGHSVFEHFSIFNFECSLFKRQQPIILFYTISSIKNIPKKGNWNQNIAFHLIAVIVSAHVRPAELSMRCNSDWK